jgi:hypothetical protein
MFYFYITRYLSPSVQKVRELLGTGIPRYFICSSAKKYRTTVHLRIFVTDKLCKRVRFWEINALPFFQAIKNWTTCALDTYFAMLQENDLTAVPNPIGSCFVLYVQLSLPIRYTGLCVSYHNSLKAMLIIQI